MQFPYLGVYLKNAKTNKILSEYTSRYGNCTAKKSSSVSVCFLTTLDSACTSDGWLKLYLTGIGSHALVR